MLCHSVKKQESRKRRRETLAGGLRRTVNFYLLLLPRQLYPHYRLIDTEERERESVVAVRWSESPPMYIHKRHRKIDK